MRNERKEAERQEYVQHHSIKRTYEEELKELRAENEKLKKKVKKLKSKLKSKGCFDEYIPLTDEQMAVFKN